MRPDWRGAGKDRIEKSSELSESEEKIRIGESIFVIRTFDSDNAGRGGSDVGNRDWGSGGEEESSRSAANSASYFHLISSSFSALRWARVESALAAIAASVPVILRRSLFLWRKLRSLSSCSGGGSCSGRLFRLSFLAFKASTILLVWALNARANSSEAVPENCFYYSTTSIAVSSMWFWPWFRYWSPECLSYSEKLSSLSMFFPVNRWAKKS